MPETIESLYTQIGQAIADAIPEAWSAAKVDVSIRSGVVLLEGHYQPAADGSERSFLMPSHVVTLFSRLHDEMIETMAADWHRARFSIDSNGTFDMAYEY